MIFASLFLLPFSIKKALNELKDVQLKTFFLLLLSGLFLALHFASWIRSLDMTNVLSSVVLVTTTPIWVSMISPFFFRDKISKKFLLGLLIAFAGILIVSGVSIADLDTSGMTARDPLAQPNKLQGNLLALAGAFFAAGYVIIGRMVRQQISTRTYTFGVYTASSIFLLAYILLFTRGGLRIGEKDLIWLVLLALIPQLIGHSLINRFLGNFPAHTISISLLGEPIGSTILAVIFLGEIPEIHEITGSAVILSGILLAITGSLNKKKPNPANPVKPD